VITDAQITTALQALDPSVDETVPFIGEWHNAPYPERTVDGRSLVALVTDSEGQFLGLDRNTGEVLIVAGGEIELVNRSLDQFIAATRAYDAALDEASEIDDEEDDAAFHALSERTHAALEAIDPDAVRDENQFWSIAARELGYGM